MITVSNVFNVTVGQDSALTVSTSDPDGDTVNIKLVAKCSCRGILHRWSFQVESSQHGTNKHIVRTGISNYKRYSLLNIQFD